MSFRINTNVSALFSNMYGKQIQHEANLSLEKLSTGLRINRAADDSAGLAIANQLRSQHQGLTQANKNAADAISLVKIADGAMDEYQKILVTARDKASQAISDTNSPEARAALEADVKALMEQADQIAKTTSFNGISLLDGTFTDKSFQVGAYSGQTMSMSIANTDIASQGLDDASIDLTTGSGAADALADIDTAIKAIDTIRSGIGSKQSALESRVRVNDATAVNVQAAESQIRDVDYAAETERLQKNTLKAQANAFALSKSFESQSLILNLLR